MSTKINVRSPFYLHLTEPQIPLRLYDCGVANLTGFSIDNQGVITEPSPDYGLVYSYTSSASDFADGKFATVSNDTSRTVIFTLTIPFGFSNSADLYLECGLTTTQAGTTTSTIETPCTPSVTTSGSIPAQTLDAEGDTTDIDLSGYFTGETTYAVSNANPLLITTALSGSILTLTSNTLAGSATIYAIGRDNSYPTTCEAVQPISITVNATGITWSCTFPVNPALSGGLIAADGTLTNPQVAAVITAVKTGSCSGSAYVADPNNTGSDRSVTLYFDITVPVGYDNAGSTVCCSHTFTQPTVGVDPIFNCDIAALTGQKIAKDGSISLGTATNGTVNSFTPPSPPFGTVETDTARVVEYQVEIPSGYQNVGTEINCSKTVIQPATVSICGSNTFYLTSGKNNTTDFCDGTYAARTEITSTATTIPQLLGSQICRSGSAFDGKILYYGVSTASMGSVAGVGVGDYYTIQIDTNGIVIDVQANNCQGAGGTGASVPL